MEKDELINLFKKWVSETKYEECCIGHNHKRESGGFEAFVWDKTHKYVIQICSLLYGDGKYEVPGIRIYYISRGATISNKPIVWDDSMDMSEKEFNELKDIILTKYASDYDSIKEMESEKKTKAFANFPTK